VPSSHQHSVNISVMMHLISPTSLNVVAEMDTSLLQTGETAKSLVG